MANDVEYDQKTKEPTTIKFTWTDYSRKNLRARIHQLQRQDVRSTFEPHVRVIQFLREVSNRAPLMLPALYVWIGASAQSVEKGLSYPKVVQAKVAEHSSLLSMSLISRAVFDESNDPLTGKAVATAPETVMRQVAKHWNEQGGRAPEEALKALDLLQRLFRSCARQKKVLISAGSLLERRVGLMKYHADRQAAHITLDPFLFSPVDLIHVVAAITVVGAVIVEFDDKRRAESYFNQVDEAAWQAAKEAFPSIPMRQRLFADVDIHQQARNCWRIEEHDGLSWMLNQLAAAIGYWDSEDDAADEVQL